MLHSKNLQHVQYVVPELMNICISYVKVMLTPPGPTQNSRPMNHIRWESVLNGEMKEEGGERDR